MTPAKRLWTLAVALIIKHNGHKKDILALMLVHVLNIVFPSWLTPQDIHLVTAFLIAKVSEFISRLNKQKLASIVFNGIISDQHHDFD